MSFFPSFTQEIVDGAAGLAPPGGPQALVAGVSDAGAVGASNLIGKESDLSVLGVGPLVDRLRDIQAEGDAQLNVVAVRLTETAAGTIGTITKTGTGLGVQATSGTSKRFADVVVIATLDGANGVAKVKVSLDGGKIFTPEEVIPGIGFLVLGDTGVRLDFTDAIAPADSVDVDDKWEFFITEPTTTMAQTLTDIATAMDTFNPPRVYLVGESDNTDWAAAAQEAADRLIANKPTWFLLESVLPDVLTGELLSTWLTARVADNWTGLWVSICSAYGRVFNADANENIRRNLAGFDLARRTRYQVQESIGRVDRGALPGVELMDGFSNVEGRTLEDAQYTSLVTYPFHFGVYFSNGRMKAPVGSDYIFQEIVDVAHKVLRGQFIEAMRFMQRDINAAEVIAFRAGLERPLDRMVAAVPRPELLGYLVTIPEGQDIANNGITWTNDLEGVPVVRKLRQITRFKFGTVI